LVNVSLISHAKTMATLALHILVILAARVWFAFLTSALHVEKTNLPFVGRMKIAAPTLFAMTTIALPHVVDANLTHALSTLIAARTWFAKLASAVDVE
jgi:hypothetical protein